ncbi:aminodeoxychorismate synthase component I [Nocardia takedensis]
MRTLLVDNYDSFTYNLYQLLSEVNGVEPTVVRNDDTRALDPGDYDNIVISPGPGRPDRAADMGVSTDLIARTTLPLLGVCLGHQGIVIGAGGQVARAPLPRHGYLDHVAHDDRDLFAGLPQGFTAVRYHSLCAATPLPTDLEITASSADGVVMGVRHRRRPQWGVQFHPESIASDYGAALLRNFAALTARHRHGLRAGPPPVANAPTSSVDRSGTSPARRGAHDPDRHDPAEGPVGRSPVAVPDTAELAADANPVDAQAGSADPVRDAPFAVRDQLAALPHGWMLRHRVLERAIDTEAIFLRLHRDSPTAFWLDSEHVEPGSARFSFLGDASGPLAEVVRYRVGAGSVEVTDAEARVRTVAGDVLDYLAARLRELRVDIPDLPFDFPCGYVGYLGYEVKADCGAEAAHRAAAPDAQWIFADRLVAVDHLAGRTHLLTLTDPAGEAGALDWLRDTAEILESLPTWANPPALEVPVDIAAVADLFGRGPARYRADIAACLEQLRAGESYEICLTDTLSFPAAENDGLDLYRALRRCNPAPYAAYLRFDGLDIACSSPERFLRVDRDRTVESKPIKGTAPRGETREQDERVRRELAADPKTRAENLMIVDLLRNDLGRVCRIGSVHVPELMAVETYTTLHQLVSTVRGTLRPEVEVVDCLRACFPGGSMTGAPKLRTMRILDGLETEARGVYSGTIGFLGLGGAADLNIVIRTAVRHEGRWRIGAGGAIVLDSDPEQEYREILWKAAAVHRAADPAVQRRGVAGGSSSGRERPRPATRPSIEIPGSRETAPNTSSPREINASSRGHSRS